MENNKIFTDVEDVDREILLRIPHDTDLFKACSLSIYTQKLCNNYFWKQRFIRKYDVDLGHDIETKSQINYRELYRKLINKSKYGILIYGAKKGYFELIKEMIRKGANIHTENDRALRVAAGNGYLEIVKYLIEKAANIHAVNDLALRIASKKGHLEVVKYLIENGADIDAEYDDVIRSAAANGHLEVVKYLIENGARNNMALGPAAKNGHLEVIRYLIENGTDIHAYGDGALRAAALNVHLELTKYLLERGANWKKISNPSDPVQQLIDQYGKDW